MKATLRNYRQAPRKVRLVADAVRGKRLDEAQTVLRYANKRAAEPVRKLLDSALANAQQAGRASDASELYVQTVTVNEGFMLKRALPRAFGRATPINKRTSHVYVELAPRAQQEAQASTHTQHENEPAPSA